MKRYAYSMRHHHLTENVDGDWVRFEDAESWGAKKVQSLIDEREELKQALAVAHASGQKWMDDYMASCALNVRLQAQVDRLGKELRNQGYTEPQVFWVTEGRGLAGAGSAQQDPGWIASNDTNQGHALNCRCPLCLADGAKQSQLRQTQAAQQAPGAEKADRHYADGAGWLHYRETRFTSPFQAGDLPCDHCGWGVAQHHSTTLACPVPSYALPGQIPMSDIVLEDLARGIEGHILGNQINDAFDLAHLIDYLIKDRIRESLERIVPVAQRESAGAPEVAGSNPAGHGPPERSNDPTASR